MATLDDKLLGEKKHYYCSSSESEDEENDSDKEICYEGKSQVRDISKSVMKAPDTSGLSRNTGPKGVIDDWQQYLQLENEQLNKNAKEKIDMIKNLSLTCSSVLEDERNDLDSEMTDSFLSEYRKKRILEMLSETSAQKVCFGELINLSSGDDYLNAIDKEDKCTSIIIHVYNTTNSACKKLNSILPILAQEYKNVKFCKMLASAVGLSVQFKMDGVPALLVYKNQQLIGNMLRITDELGYDFYESDIENYLIEHGFIQSKDCIPSIIKDRCDNEDSDD